MSDQLECPDCGNRILTRTGGGGRWGVISTSYHCTHCGRSFTQRQRRRRKGVEEGGAGADLDSVTEYDPQPIKVRCPACDRGNAPVTSKKNNGIRHHRCLCGHCFKSVERNHND